MGRIREGALDASQGERKERMTIEVEAVRAGIALHGGLVGVTDVAARYNVTRQRVYQWAMKSDFPAPVGRVGDSHVWLAADVQAWHSARETPT